ncbi:MAG TPA: hypothetical protein VHB02_06195 [Acidimicrobiales bacterium]|nr:hypothetical protein [Acidimicrobiales bacterium]
MARTEARIFTSIWEDEDFLALEAGEQRLFFLLLSQADLTMCGVLTDLPDWWAGMASDTSDDDIEANRDGLVASSYLVRDERSKEVWIRSFIRGDRVLESANFAVSMARSFGTIRSKAIRKGVLEELTKAFPEGVLKGMTDKFTNREKEGWKPFLNRLPEGFVKAVHSHALIHPITPSPHHPVTPSPLLACEQPSKTYAGGEAFR